MLIFAVPKSPYLDIHHISAKDNFGIIPETSFKPTSTYNRREILNSGEIPTRPLSILHFKKKKSMEHNHSKAIYYLVEILQA